MQAVVVGIIAILVGLGIGYFTWGSQAGQIRSEVTSAMARIAELQKTAAQEEQLVTSIQALEGKLKEAQESLQKEQELTTKLEAVAATKTTK